MSYQLSLSFELICLMDWLLKNKGSKLKDLVKEAVDKQLADSLEKMSEHDYVKMASRMHDVVIDFVIFLEDMLIEELEGVSPDLNVREKMFPAIKHMDIAKFDINAVWLSMQQAKIKFMKKRQRHSGDIIGAKVASKSKISDDDIKQELFKQLLKNWQPKGKEPVN